MADFGAFLNKDIEPLYKFLYANTLWRPLGFQEIIRGSCKHTEEITKNDQPRLRDQMELSIRK